MSNSHNKASKKTVLKPIYALKSESEEENHSIFDFLRGAPPGFCEVFFQVVAHLDEKMGRMNMRSTPRPQCKTPYEIPEVEKEEDSIALHLKVTAPAPAKIRKEDTQVFVENGVLNIEVDEEPIAGSSSDGVKKESGEPLRFFIKHTFGSTSFYKLKEIKAELNDGVLKVVVPKGVKNEEDEEDEDDVIQVEVN